MPDTLAGNVYGITGLTMTLADSGASQYDGFFSKVIGGAVRNLQIGNTISETYTGTGSAYVGALAGTTTNAPVIANVTTTSSDTVTGTNALSNNASNNTMYVGGLLGFNAGTAIIVGSSAAGNVYYYITGNTNSTTSNAFVGCLIGRNNSTAVYDGSTTFGSVYNSSASGNVYAQYSGAGAGNASIEIGGLFGAEGGGGATASYNNYATGNVTSNLVGGNEQIGGLSGYMNDTSSYAIVNSYSTTGTPSYTGTGTGSSAISIGGLVGNIFAGTVTGTSSSYLTYSSEAVSYNGSAAPTIWYLGGLVGYNGGTITYAKATGDVSYTGSTINAADVGGLVGYNVNIISNSTTATTDAYATTGVVTATANLSGSNASTISVGGLVGRNGISTANGTISGSSSSENVVYNYTNTTWSSGTSTAEAGGLVGLNNSTAAYDGSTTFGSVYNSNASGTVTAQYTGGSSGQVTAYVGGLIGLNGNTTATATATYNNYATGSVASSLIGATEYIGGLVGYQGSTSANAITNSYSTTGAPTFTGAATSGTGLVALAGLVGYNNGGTITGTSSSYLTYSSENVIYNGTATPGAFYLGGLVGRDSDTITYAKATGSVSLTAGATTGYVGGLVGNNNSAIIVNSKSSGGTVTGTANVSGSNINTFDVGGLVGLNGGTAIVSGSNSSENVVYNYTGTTTSNNSNTAIGGLVGYDTSTAAYDGTTTFGSVYTSYASGSVTAQYSGGGSGKVNNPIGGLVGQLGSGAGSASVLYGDFATGNVTSNMIGASTSVGGLVGYSNSNATVSIIDSYATGAATYTGVTGGVTTTAYAGGLLGQNASTSTISYSYSTGYVNDSGSGTNLSGGAGGFIGNNAGTSGNTNFWDKTTSGQSSASIAGTDTAVGESWTTSTNSTTDPMQATSTTLPSIFTTAGWSTNVWGAVNGANPYLLGIFSSTPVAVSGYAYSDAGSTILKCAAIAGYFGGSLVGTASSGNNGYYSILLPNGSTSLLTVFTGGTKGDAFDDTISSSLSNFNIYGNYLRIMSGSSSFSTVTTALSTALGSNSGSNFLWSLSSGNVTMNTGKSFAYNGSATGFTLDKTITADSGSVLVANTGDITLNSAINTSSGNVIIDADSDASLEGFIKAYANITTTGGNIYLGGGADATTGYAYGSSTTNYQYGINIGAVTINAGTGNITMHVYGGGYTNTNYGVEFKSNSTMSGNVADIYGTGGTGSGGLSYGISVDSTLTVTNLGTLNLYGTGGTGSGGSNYGVGIATGGGIASTGSSAINLTGTAGTGGSSNYGINSVSGATIGGASYSGNVALIADTVSLAGAITTNASGSVTYKQKTNGTAINVATGASGLQITSGILDNTTTGTVIIGDSSNTGGVNVGTYSWNSNAQIFSGSGGINISGAETMGNHTFFARTYSTGDITIGASGSVGSTSSTANAITLVAAHNFANNNSSASTLADSSSNWLVYSTNPANDARGGLVYNFKQYNATYGTTSVLGTGNGFLYTLAPTVSETLIGSVTKVYDAQSHPTHIPTRQADRLLSHHPIYQSQLTTCNRLHLSGGPLLAFPLFPFKTVFLQRNVMEATVIKQIRPQDVKIPEQFRSNTGNEADLRRLGENMLSSGQLSPIGVTKGMVLLYGARRTLASILVGKETIDAIVYENPLSRLEYERINFSENFHRLDISGYDKFRACEKMLSQSSSWTPKDLAAYLNVEPSTITKFLSPAKCTSDWIDALKAGTVTISDCYTASMAPPEQQKLLLEMKLGGANREALHRAVRNINPKREKNVARVSRVSVPLNDGTKLVITGSKLSLSDIVENLAACLESARKGAKEKLDARTWERVMRDKFIALSGDANHV